MSMEQDQLSRISESSGLETCTECGKSFSHSSYLDHLFRNKDCMRRYWQEEEKTHVYRLRHHKGIKNSLKREKSPELVL